MDTDDYTESEEFPGPYVRVRGVVFHSACARYRRRRV